MSNQIEALTMGIHKSLHRLPDFLISSILTISINMGQRHSAWQKMENIITRNASASYLLSKLVPARLISSANSFFNLVTSQATRNSNSRWLSRFTMKKFLMKLITPDPTLPFWTGQFSMSLNVKQKLTAIQNCSHFNFQGFRTKISLLA